MEVAMIEAGLEGANEPAMHHALDLASEALIRFGIACWDAGADMLHCGDSLASCDVISPKTFERFSYPYLKKVFDAWADHGVDASCCTSAATAPRYSTSTPTPEPT